MSPWIITLEALEASRVFRQHQPVVPFTQHLSEDKPSDKPCLDIRCSVHWIGAKKNVQPMEVSRAEYRETYWTYRQLVAHQTRNGSVIASGDLVGTGTMSAFEVSNHAILHLRTGLDTLLRAMIPVDAASSSAPIMGRSPSTLAAASRALGWRMETKSS